MHVFRQWIVFIAVTIALACGCRSDDHAKRLFGPSSSANFDPLDAYLGPSLPIEQPACVPIGTSNSRFESAPLEDFKFGQPGSFRMMSLEECIYAALQNSPVIRELGGAILRFPEQVSTINDPALVYSDPRFGEEAALSEFDASLSSQFIFQKNDRAFNNAFIGDNGFLQQDLATYRAGLSKVSATGARFEFNQEVNYDLNNSPSNRFNPVNGTQSSNYDTFFEAGFRQPLFQGAGVEFNRIAGPNNATGVYNGVLIARTNTDITIAEFETQLRNLVSNVENSYWDLYYAYRDLEARVEARNGAYRIWQNADANEREAAVINQAKEQYYRFASDVANAIHGRLNEGTQTNNGSAGGTFRSNIGVRTAERRLRLISGMQLNDAQLIVPGDLPTEAAVVFDWEQSKADALAFRPELRRQRWRVKRRELELLASRNYLLPRVDLLGKYRLRGFGDNLFGEQGFTQTATGPDALPGSSATASLLDGDLQEWEMGFDVNVPIGYRRQHAAFRAAELAIARENGILAEQERSVIYGLSNALGEITRSVTVRDANIKRVEAAVAQLESVKLLYEDDDRNIDQLLEAERRVIEAKTQFYQSQVEYMLAIRSVHFETGTLFRYHNVQMSENGIAVEARRQASERSQWKKFQLNYRIPGIHIGKNGTQVAGDDTAKRLRKPELLGNRKSTSETDASPLMEISRLAKSDE